MWVQQIMKQQLPKGFKMISAGIPITVNTQCFFMPVQSEIKKLDPIALKNETIPYLKKCGDRDNIEKFILDSGNKLLWDDDSQIYDGRLTKYYSLNPRTEVEIIWDQK